MANVLVTGGAGYIGSHACKALTAAGFTPVTFDNLITGWREAVKFGPFIQGDLLNKPEIDAVFAQYKPVAVMHFAALSQVGDSMKHPGSYWRNNVQGSLNLIEAAVEAECRNFVFSSTCATYGDPVRLPMDESHPQAPLNPYGRTKLMIEEALSDYSHYVGFRSVCLRYFNAAGADDQGRIGERHDPETHAIPLALQAALGQRSGFKLFGDDYDTRDGTAIRDYIHVLDLADAHVRALKYLLAGGETTALNLGTGTGTTVTELIDTIRHTTSLPFPVDVVERRQGDAPSLVADNRLARSVLGWVPKLTLEDIVQSAWRWHAAEGERIAAATNRSRPAL